MDHRDWGRDNLAPHERQTVDAWPHDHPPPDDPGTHTGDDPEFPDRPPSKWPPDQPHHAGGRHRDEDRGGERLTNRPREQAGWPGTDATGGWQRISETADWHRTPADDTGEWTYHPQLYDQGELTGTEAWNWSTDTGQWDRFTDTGEWNRGDLTDPDRSKDGRAHRPRHSQPETFWEGTRLSGDDPRWMATPASAPRSPAVAYPNPPDNLPALRVPRHAESSAPGTPAEIGALDDDRDGSFTAVLYAAAWYVVPLLVFYVWMLTLDGSAPAGCVTDANGGGCTSERADALASSMAAARQFGAALGSSLVVALLLRWMSTWRAAAVGLAAAVIGGGLSTVLFQLVG